MCKLSNSVIMVATAVSYGLVAVIILATLGALKAMGRVWGEPKLWTSQANSSSTSQRLADPYTFSHVLHGVLFYWMLSWSSMAVSTKLLVSMGLEAAWEISENTEAVIKRYRAQTISLGYNGDSVLNSFGDLLATAAGFFMAKALPWWASAAFLVTVELVLLATIRDNLTLNIVQLIAPSERIKKWQSQKQVTVKPTTTDSDSESDSDS